MPPKGNAYFYEVTRAVGLEYLDKQVDFIDFNIQKLLPHKLTQYGPSLASGDLNGDGLHDVIVGGGSPDYASIFIQQKNGQFLNKPITTSEEIKYQDDAGLCLFDADNDGDLDLYIASGGGENEPQSKAYLDHFYENDGKGNFSWVNTAIPDNRATKSCVKATDFDEDGDLDLFIGGRFIPGRYPASTSSFLLRNDCQKGKIQFTDVTATMAPELQQVGMVTDAIWSDADHDGVRELLITTEWGGIQILKKKGNSWNLQKTSLQNETGWWNSITAADIDNDGDIDYVTGNYGNNGYIKATAQYPAKIYAKDFDNNTSYDAIVSHFQLSNSSGKGEVKEFPVAGRDDFIKEMTITKEKFTNYGIYAKTPMQEVFPKESYQDALQLSAINFNSCWIENKGNLQFEVHALPAEAQFAPVYGILTKDINRDGYLDLLLNGNEFSMAPALGRNDAFNGVVLMGNGKDFKAISPQLSGFYVAGNGKALIELAMSGNYAVVASQNFGPLKTFKQTTMDELVALLPDDRYVSITLKNGQTRKQELYWGSGFLSQSPNMVSLNPSVRWIEVTNRKGDKRKLK
jgi:hypothetical protein